MPLKLYYGILLPILMFVYGIKLYEAVPCFYNNQLYQQNETWRLNCKQSCTCEGGATPIVRCYDHCLQWFSLHPDCQLKPPAPGKCCAEPSCPQHVRLNYPTGYISPDCPVSCSEEYVSGQGNDSTPTTTGPSCVYNNKTYSRGETWIENCQQSCTCVGGAMGFVSCRDLCLQWHNLPSVCKLKPPAPGKCCPEPDCPAYMQLKYPQGYTPPDCPPSCQSGKTTDKKTPEVPNTEKSCSFNNKVYSPGETWISSDCRQKCSCDGTSGDANCRNLCLQWPTLPLECQMEPPAPGKCCPEPSCPSYIRIRYPTAYVPPDCPTSCSSAEMASYRPVSDTRSLDNANYCLFNSNKYKQGDTWIDSCAQFCTCENGTTGYVSCRDLCLHWYNLPPECQLKSPEPGKCCPEPSCPAIYQIQYPPGYVPLDCPASCRMKIMSKYNMAVKTLNMGNTCWYKNQTYSRGDTWIENCKQLCSCEGGLNGYIKCRDLCLNWTNLPAVCQLKPPAKGKCCSEPSCPSYITLQYPPGYSSPSCPDSCSVK